MNNDLKEAVARALWNVNEDEKTFDEALQGEVNGNKQDIDALYYVREMAKAAITVMIDKETD